VSRESRKSKLANENKNALTDQGKKERKPKMNEKEGPRRGGKKDILKLEQKGNTAIDGCQTA